MYSSIKEYFLDWLKSYHSFWMQTGAKFDQCKLLRNKAKVTSICRLCVPRLDQEKLPPQNSARVVSTYTLGLSALY